MRRLVIVLSVGFIVGISMVADAAPTAAQMSPEDKAARNKAAKLEQKEATKLEQKEAKQKQQQQQKAAKQQPLPASGGPPVGAVALYTLGASALVVGSGVFLVGRTVARR